MIFLSRPLSSTIFYLLLFHSMFISSLHNIKSKNFKIKRTLEKDEKNLLKFFMLLVSGVSMIGAR
jgi:hypothetical protein